MQLIIVEADGSQAAAMAELADEMTEDPRCSIVLRGLRSGDAATAVVISGWDDVVADEVHAGLVMSGWTARRFDMAE